MATRIQVRRGTTGEWNAANPTLEEGEIGYNSTLGQMKIGDGSTAWSSLYYIENSSTLGSSLGSYVLDSEKSAVNGIAELDGSKNILAPAGIIFEGATADAYETTLQVTDPTADRTITLPNVSGTVITTGDTGTVTSTMIADGTIVNGDINASAAIAQSKIANLTTDLAAKASLSGATFTGGISGTSLILSGNLTVQGTTTTIDSTTIAIQNAFVFEGSTSDAYETTLTVVDPTADRTITLPNVSGTVITTGNFPALTWGQLKLGGAI